MTVNMRIKTSEQVNQLYQFIKKNQPLCKLGDAEMFMKNELKITSSAVRYVRLKSLKDSRTIIVEKGGWIKLANNEGVK